MNEVADKSVEVAEDDSRIVKISPKAQKIFSALLKLDTANKKNQLAVVEPSLKKVLDVVKDKAMYWGSLRCRKSDERSMGSQLGGSDDKSC